MLGKVGQGGAPMMRPPTDSVAGGGVDLEGRGVEVGTSVKVDHTGSSASSTEPKFGEVWSKIQSQYGAKAEKPREVKKTLGKDDFLRLMITQMKFQDPSKPFEMEKMGAEMAQLSSMEQLQNLNQTMKALVNRDQPMERMAMTGMIGKLVSVDRQRFPHTEGESNVLKFNLPQDASKLSVTILDQTGTPILEKELGPQKKGEGIFSWDGLKANTIAAKSGNYTYKVTALDSGGQEIKMSQAGNARVVGVSFEGQKPVLLVGDSANPEKVFMENVSRIVDDGGLASASATIPGARSLAQASAEARPTASDTTSNFFTFKKGEGSKPLEAGALSAEQAKALESANEAGQGFPHGLNSSE
ncbi:MAG: flagellar hook assembly protein FlgD [Bdellovibrionales bacterium]|nr:flagellar hook assembly protein FlgD [Bdellovibrionales bacterium]